MKTQIPYEDRDRIPMKFAHILWVAAITPAGLAVAWLICEIARRAH